MEISNSVLDLGVDMGRYAVKAVAGSRSITFPAYAVPYEAPLLGIGMGQSPDILIGWGGNVWTVGEGAIRQGDGNRPETAAWIETPEYLALFRRALTDLVPERWFHVNVVAGLPISDFRRDSEELRQALLQVHTFRQGGQVVNAHVANLRIVPQAWGAVLALLLNGDGSIADADLLNQRIAVVDIGGHTANLLTVKGLSDIPSESVSLNVGAWDVVRTVRQFLAGLGEGFASLNDHEVMRVCLAGRVWNGAKREWVDLHQVVQPKVEHLGRDIVEHARTFWHGGEAFNRLLLIGGGSYLWQEVVERAFPQVNVLPEPEMANARGFAAFAAYLSQEGLWEQA